MDRISRWEWHGNSVILVLLCLTGVLLPIGVIYFLTHLLKVEEEVKDASKLSDFIEARRKR